MPLIYRIDSAARVVRLDYEGNPSYAEAEAVLRTLVRDPAYERGFAFLVDRSSAGPPSADYIRSLIGFVGGHKDWFEGSCWALVASGQVQFGMARMSQLLSSDMPVRVEIFSDVDTAESWLRDCASEGDGPQVSST